MTTPLSLEHITGSLFGYWADNFPQEVTTLYPGTTINTAELSEWLELWVTSASDRPGRATGSKMVDVLVTVHIFSRDPANFGRGQQLADAVRTTLSQRLLPISDQQLSGETPTGFLALFEAETRELTRADPAAREQSLQHVVITCPGRVEQAET